MAPEAKGLLLWLVTDRGFPESVETPRMCEVWNPVGVMVPSLAETWVLSNENMDIPHQSSFSNVFDSMQTRVSTAGKGEGA
jgi:hypothetical protein